MAGENLSAKEARKAAQAARAAAQAAEKQRERKVRLIGGSVVAVILAALIAIPLITGRGKVAGLRNDAQIPAGVSRETYGLRIGPAWDAPNAESIPKLQIWEDFQCPVCRDMEKASGSTIVELAMQGKLRLEWRPVMFLDESLAEQNAAANNPQSSTRATMALGCAADAGVAHKYHSAVFDLQPKNEGDGYSSAALLKAAETSGLSGDKFRAFSACVDSEKYADWAFNTDALFAREGNTGTPTGYLNGKELEQQPVNVLMDPAALTKAIAEAAKS